MPDLIIKDHKRRPKLIAPLRDRKHQHSIYQQVALLAEKEAITLDQFVATALAEKLAALMTENYLAQRAARADRQKFFRGDGESTGCRTRGV